MAPAERFFFHTDLTWGSRITIDLEQTHAVHQIVITNRADAAQDRARGLFAVLHEHPDLRRGTAFAVAPQRGFLAGSLPEAALTIGGHAARDVTLTSPFHTALHFADIRAYGTPQPARARRGKKQRLAVES